MSRYSKSKCVHFLFFCVLAVFCFYQTTAAQSGRRVKKAAETFEQKTPAETKSAADSDNQKDEASVRISSLILVGELQHNFTYYSSNEIDVAFKEGVRMFKTYSNSPVNVTRGGGKISYAAAKEQAKNEPDAYILWLGFAAKEDGNGSVYIDSVQYAVLAPKTAKVVTRGEIKPKQNGVLSTGGVLNIPDNRRRSRSLTQMKDGVREIFGILQHGGWLD